MMENLEISCIKHSKWNRCTSVKNVFTETEIKFVSSSWNYKLELAISAISDLHS